MAEKDYVPETLRGALEAGMLGPYLRKQAIWYAGLGAVLVLALLYFAIFPPAKKPDVAEATAHVQALWKAGDQKGAIAYYLPVAEQGDATAEFDMAVLYENAGGTAHSDREAAKWYEKAAGHGHLIAQVNLSDNYFKGRGVPKDADAAYRWAALAAAHSRPGTQVHAVAAANAAEAGAKLSAAERRAADSWVRGWKAAEP